MSLQDDLEDEFETGMSDGTFKLGWWIGSDERRMRAFYRLDDNDVIVNGDAPAPTFTKKPEKYKEYVYDTRNTTGSSRASGDVRENADRLLEILEKHNRV